MAYREKISLLLSHTGLLRTLEQFPTSPGLVVFNHHRIGNHAECEYDRNLLSATAQQFDYQLSYIKRHFPILLPHELAELMSKKKRLTRLHAMITFDDGCLDNYTLAFELLKNHSMRAAFFLVSTFVGTPYVPWWDEIAYLVRHSPKSSISLASPPCLTVDLQADREQAVNQVLQAYKSDENQNPNAFLQELRREAQVELPRENRRYLDWTEAREMADAGMEIGAHTHTHPFLGKLSPQEQEAELRISKAIIEKNIGRPVTALAYPYGSPKDFTKDTQRIAMDAGYTTAFSFYGGINAADGGDHYNVLRATPDPLPGGFRAKAVLMSRFRNVDAKLRKTYHRIKP